MKRHKYGGYMIMLIALVIILAAVFFILCGHDRELELNPYSDAFPQSSLEVNNEHTKVLQ